LVPKQVELVDQFEVFASIESLVRAEASIGVSRATTTSERRQGIKRETAG